MIGELGKGDWEMEGNSGNLEMCVILTPQFLNTV